MAIKKKKSIRNPFDRMYRVFSNNISLQEVSIDIIGSYASRYDDSVTKDLDRLLKEKFKENKGKKAKSITLTPDEVDKLIILVKKHPDQSYLFSKNTLVSIVSVLDTLTARLFEFYFSKNPSQLSIENQSLTFSELKEIEDVSQAERYLVNREVELLLIQKGFRERLKILKDVLGIDLPQKTEIISELSKLIKIRNLIVHNEGKADANFVKLYGIEGVKVGDSIKVSKEYLVESLYLVYFFGSFLLQEAQLKFSTDKIKSDEFIINDVVHRLVKKCNYTYIGQIYTYVKEKPLDQINQKMAIVNYCIGLKKKGIEISKIKVILDKEDWSAVPHDFLMSIAALKDDDVNFYKYLELSIKNKIVGKSELEEWEIFSFYRKKTKFKTIVSKSLK